MLAAVRMTAFLVDRAALLVPTRFPAASRRCSGSGSAWPSPAGAAGYTPRDTAGFVTGARPGARRSGRPSGFLVFVVFSAVQSAGSLIDLFGGFQLAQAFDPQSMVNGAQFTRLFQMTALALLFASGGYQLIIGGLTRQLRRAAARPAASTWPGRSRP